MSPRAAAALAVVAVLALPLAALPAIIHVPADEPTIQAGIDAAAVGDTVEVACGTYYEHDIELKSDVVLRSETGQPDCVTIDAQSLGRVLHAQAVVAAALEGLTVTGGVKPGPYPTGLGGGLFCEQGSSFSIDRCDFVLNHADDFGGALCSYSSSPSVRDCRFLDNTANYGGALELRNGSAASFLRCHFFGNSSTILSGAVNNAWCQTTTNTFTECLFVGNAALHGGGALTAYYSSPHIERCTFFGNSAGTIEHGGSGVFSTTGSSPTVTQTIIAFGTDREGVLCWGGGTITLSCTDIFGNPGGDWVGAIANQLGVNGNISADPLFCDPTNDNFFLDASSPCLPGNHPDGADCGLIGALGQGCGPISIQPDSWAVIKSKYRTSVR